MPDLGPTHWDAVQGTDDESAPLTCPECGCGRFDLMIGGLHSGRIECSSCGYPLAPGANPVGQGTVTGR